MRCPLGRRAHCTKLLSLNTKYHVEAKTIAHPFVDPSTIMPLRALSASASGGQAPSYQTPEQHATTQQSTPTSFSTLPPVLRFHAQGVRVRIEPGLLPPNDHHSTEAGAVNGNGNGNGSTSTSAAAAYQATGQIWITEKSITFQPDQSSSEAGEQAGFELDYPSLSLHAVTRSVPASLLSGSGNGSGGEADSCLYCQLDDNPEQDEEDSAQAYADDDDDDDEEAGAGAGSSGIREMWILFPSSSSTSLGQSATEPTQPQTSLEAAFDALSLCSSLHPSAGADGSEGMGHPFAGLGAFGTGAFGSAGAGAGTFGGAGAFDDADENGDDAVIAGQEDAEHAEGAEGAAGLTDSGRVRNEFQTPDARFKPY